MPSDLIFTASLQTDVADGPVRATIDVANESIHFLRMIVLSAQCPGFVSVA
jgi:hypothetical protein